MISMNFRGPFADVLKRAGFEPANAYSVNRIISGILDSIASRAEEEDCGTELLLLLAVMNLPEASDGGALCEFGDEACPNAGSDVTCDDITVTLRSRDGRLKVLPYGLIYASEVDRFAPHEFHGTLEEITDDAYALFAPRYRDLSLDDRYATLRCLGKSREDAATMAEDTALTTEKLFAMVAAR